MRFLSIALCCAVLQPHAYGQTTSPPAGQPDAPLNMTVIRGNGNINNVRKRAMSESAVRLTDAAGKPVPGAAVTFILPTQGASGDFSNGSKSITVPTDTSGVASVLFKPNTLTGQVEVRVNASHLGQTARAVIAQNNLVVPGAGGGSGKVIAILAILGGAAAGGAIAFTRSQGGSSATPSAPAAPPAPIVITPGAGSAGPPF